MQGSCFWRTFHEGNISRPNDWAYGVESLFHEQLLQSPHRTLDPEEADFFYVPVYTSCFIHPVYAWADMPFFYGPEGEALTVACIPHMCVFPGIARSYAVLCAGWLCCLNMQVCKSLFYQAAW